MSYKLVENVTSHFIKEIAKDNYDFLVIINPTKNMTVKTVNSTCINKRVFAFNNVTDTAELQELLLDLLNKEFKVKVLYISLSSKEVKGSRKLISSLRDSYSNLNVIYFNHNYLNLLKYSAETFTVEVMDSFGLNVSKKVTTILDKALGGLDIIVREAILASSDTSDYIKNCVSEYSKHDSNIYLLDKDNLMLDVRSDILPSVTFINSINCIDRNTSSNNVILHIVSSPKDYLEVDRDLAYIYCPILIV